MVQERLTVVNETGLHARPASELVKAATGFVSTIKILTKERQADAKSIINVLSLGLRKDDEITLEVEGIDEADAMSHIKALFLSGFGDA
ncbi:HPr family phosphocarrier protein [Acidaminobacter sp. JC074]|uniref:HPr family phosphocarrier protein n=1 Tax=Acidaminobacter sp. JC074 TaxID=2530199 RepID=UPI001F0F87C5|nr:HPr family phosphocarrier protein [Acidaminobacter sp. JC074]MCH4889530.1 HPr family phosphocarrier protein [Acidaminobacter sp. JC074]